MIYNIGGSLEHLKYTSQNQNFNENFVCLGHPDGFGLSWKVDFAGPTADRTGETLLNR